MAGRSFIISHSLIGKGIPEVAGTYKAHGEAGAKFVDAGRKGLRSARRTLFRFEGDLRLLRRAQEEVAGRLRAVGKNLQRVA